MKLNKFEIINREGKVKKLPECIKECVHDKKCEIVSKEYQRGKIRDVMIDIAEWNNLDGLVLCIFCNNFRRE